MKTSKIQLALISVIACAAITLCLAVCAQAQTLNYFADFNGVNGWEPYASLTQATDGNFYGAGSGGIYGGGNLFRMTPKGEITSIYKFCSQPKCLDGVFPTTPPVLASDGSLYGVTATTFCKLAPGSKLTTLYNFCSSCGIANGVILASDGNFYGTANYSGINYNGTIFKISPTGKYTQLYAFCAMNGCADGQTPLYPPVQGDDGNFYGTTSTGGTFGAGLVWELTASGIYKVIYNFCSTYNGLCPDGSYPYAITKDAQGDFVGTTSAGGANYGGVIFKITPDGHYSVLHNFTSELNLGWPGSQLTLASDGNLYGTLVGGGSGSWAPIVRGAIYEITSDGEYKELYGFCRWCSTGAFTTGGFNPIAPVIQASDGNFYGTTAFGGIGGWKGEAFAYGTAFQFSNNLGPMVETVPVAAKAGKTVLILGNGLTGSTGVTFNGVAAKFTVKSDTYIAATVPAGATTGMVSVSTPSGTLNSNPHFVVTK